MIIKLDLTPGDATILEVTLRRQGKEDLRRGEMFADANYLTRGTILLEVADQIHNRRRTTPVDLGGSQPTYTEVLNGLVRELQGRTQASDDHNAWTDHLRDRADWLDELHQGGE